jgi:hypothetical protein
LAFQGIDLAGAVGEIKGVTIVRTVEGMSRRFVDEAVAGDLCLNLLDLDALLLGGAALRLRCL